MQFLVYKASAGSGKTFTLVREYLRMALEGSDPHRFKKILAITFTNKAAAEMKERVIATLHEMGSPSGPENGSARIMAALLMDDLKIDQKILQSRASRLLSNILHQYNDFSVGTIDSFMHRVVRTFALDLHMPVNFTVELSNDVLIQMAVDELLEKIGTDKAITEALIGYTLHRTNEEKRNAIEEELAATAKDLLNEQFANPIAALKKLSINDFVQLRDQFARDCRKLESELQQLGKQAIKVLDDAGIDGNDLYRGKTGIFGWFKKLSKSGEDGLPVPTDTVLKAVHENTWYAKSKENSSAAVLIKQQSGKLGRIANEALGLIEKSLPDYNLKSLLKDELFKIALLNEISRIIDRIRNEEGIVHISEFNRRVSRIVLEEPVPFIYERLGEKYQHFMIDEFQDTSVMQWQNLLPLIQNGLAQQAGSLIVGDGKQAIYRFRGGEVGLFSKLPQPYPETREKLILERHELLRLLYKPETLKNNFRSTESIIRFNNHFYKYIAEQFLPEQFRAVYDELEQIAGRKDADGYVQIEWIPPGLSKSERSDEHKARTLRTIRDLIGNRDFKHRDIAILVRNNKQGAGLAEALVGEGIPVISGESLLVDSSPEVAMILACLHVVADRNANLNLLHICSWLISKNKLPFASMEALLDSLEKTGETELLGVLEKNGYNLRKFNQGGASLFEICNSIIRKFGIQTQEDPYVLFFLEAVWSRSGKSPTDCPVFLDWWAENREKQCLKLPETADAVRILTIHKSKGLQFPVVIFPYAHGEGSHTGVGWVESGGLLPADLPAARLPINKKLEQTPFAHLLHLENEKSILDRINLMYVATTRPETALYIISGRSGRGGSLVKGWEEYLEQYLLAVKPDEFNSGLVYWGDPAFKNRTGAASGIAAKANMPAYKPGNWRAHLKLSRKSSKAWQESNTALAWGNLLHTALEAVHSEKDIAGSLQKLLSAGLITPEDMPDLEARIREVINLPSIHEYFEEGLWVKNERELILPDGSLLRPDRVVMQDQCWIVLDYKTGKAESKHKNQIIQYMQQLKQIKPLHTKGYIIYLHQPVLVESVSLSNSSESA